ncbi:uncharacterized protein EI90DRAFT_2933015, partial [Cantharellus anzutake]|uniref:uncharacterized protein n=1 Tax=Cantharellus anzutake TaxID=1750568 RepID=UPI0019048B0E
QLSLDKGTTILGIILASDRTHLTNFTGNQKMHAVYISLGNISKNVQKWQSAHVWLLLAKIPISKFSKTHFTGNKSERESMPGILSHHLFHKCMKRVPAPLRVDQRLCNHLMANSDCVSPF